MEDRFKNFSIFKFLLFNFIVGSLLWQFHSIDSTSTSTIGMTSVIVYLSYFIYREKMTPAEFFGTISTNWSLWKSIILLILPLAILESSINPLLLSLIDHYRPYSHVPISTQVDIDVQRPLLMFNKIFLLPLQTEFFRGIIIQKFTFKYTIPYTIVLSTVIVSIFSLSPISGMLVGLVAALIYVKTKNLSNVIVFHSLIKVTVEVIDFFNVGVYPEFIVPYSFMILISFILIVYYVHINWPSNN